MTLAYEAPAFTGKNDYPIGGTKIGPAWTAAWNHLQLTSWATAHELDLVMTEAGETASKTNTNLLRRAARCGWLDVRYRTIEKRKRAQYRINQEKFGKWIERRQGR